MTKRNKAEDINTAQAATKAAIKTFIEIDRLSAVLSEQIQAMNKAVKKLKHGLTYLDDGLADCRYGVEKIKEWNKE